MSRVEVKVPDMGGAADAEVIELCVKPGDHVEVEDALIVVESDKASVEIPSPKAGTVAEFQVNVGDRISEGVTILWLEEQAGGSEAPAEAAPEQPASEEADEPETSEPQNETASGSDEVGGGQIETLRVPDIGGSEDVPVIEVSIAEGDQVALEDPLVVLESDKATMEVPAEKAGIVRKVLLKVGDTVSQGTPMVEIEVQGQPKAEKPKEKPAPEKPAASEPAPQQAQRASAAEPAQDVSEAVEPSKRVHAGPAVRKMARELGVDLAQVKGSGPSGRIVKEDLQSFIKQGMQQLRSGPTPGAGMGLPTVKLPDFSQFGDVERTAMSRIHQLTAENMQRSWLTVPHVTQFDEADITELEAFRKGQKAAAEKQGAKLTPLPFLLKACAYALKMLPQFNVSLDMERQEIVQKHYINIGVAVDTPAGLVVPVIRDVDKKGLWELARECGEMAAKARDKKLKPAEMQGGCFSISSLGSVGGTAFTPIVNTPEVAILGVSKAQFKPVYNGEGGFDPRLMLPLSLSYDHRAVNGADAARFTALLAELLGDLRKLLL